MNPFTAKQQTAELGDLLSSTVASLVSAQQQLDRLTAQQRAEYEQAPEGTLAIPPTWYTFSAVALELELSASIEYQLDVDTGKRKPSIRSSMLNQTNVSLYGYQASAGMRVRLQIEPQGFTPIKQTESLGHEYSQSNNTPLTKEYLDE